ncbi:hypothetical protein JCM11641_002906 [Rhodosporidiobolus odoratus]
MGTLDSPTRPSRTPSLSLDLNLTSPTSSSPSSRSPHSLQEQQRQQTQQHCRHLRLCQPHQRAAFELLVLGCGGGPIETNLSSYLVKPYQAKWTDGCTAIEGGSTIGALSLLIERNPYAFEGFGLEIGVDAEELERGQEGGGVGAGVVGVGREGGGKAAAKVWDLIRCFAITHAHLDHISGLVISSAACRPPPKPIYGIRRTIENIEKVMDGGIWPMLGGWEEGVEVGRAYTWKLVTAPTRTPLPLSTSLSFHAFPLAHGLDPSFFSRVCKKKKQQQAVDGNEIDEQQTDQEGKKGGCDECYDSTAFFVKVEGEGEGEGEGDEGGREMLFFGDVEPDSISKRNLNLEIWKVAAPKIVKGVLNVIFLECSYPSSQPADRLFGHFSPPFIREEMEVLADLVREEKEKAGLTVKEEDGRGPLKDVIVVIQHIKDDIFALPKPAATSTSQPLTPPSAPPSANASTAGTSPSKPVPHAAKSNGESTSGSSSAPPSRLRRAESAAAAFLTSTTPHPSTSSAFSATEQLQLLSMSPPVPSVPTRRPSVIPASTKNTYNFPRPSSPSSTASSSPLATTLARNSLYRQSTAASGTLSPNVGVGDANGTPPAGWQAALDARRASTPWAFGFGNNPFAAPVPPPPTLPPLPQPPHAAANGQPSLSLPPFQNGHGASGAHSAPPGSAPPIPTSSDSSIGAICTTGQVRSNGRGTFAFNGSLSPGGRGTSPLRSPTSAPSAPLGLGARSPSSRSRATSNGALPSVSSSGEEEEEVDGEGEGEGLSVAVDAEQLGKELTLHQEAGGEGRQRSSEEGRTEEEEEQEEHAEEEEPEMVEETVHERIERELVELEDEAKTGVRFLIARQGMRLIF